MSIFFEFDQNNSGGHFEIDDEHGIGPRVWIEAVDVAHATAIAESIGIYFDGVEQEIDCECCGDRWNRPYGSQSQPTINPQYDFSWHDTVYVHRLDGSIERLTKEDAPTEGRDDQN